MMREFHRYVPAERQTDHERTAMRLPFDDIGERIHGSGKREGLLRQRAMAGQVGKLWVRSLRKIASKTNPRVLPFGACPFRAATAWIEMRPANNKFELLPFERYTAAADQKRLSQSAISKLKPGRSV